MSKNQKKLWQLKWVVSALSICLWIFQSGCEKAEAPFSLTDTTLSIKQVDYEGAVYYNEGDPLPHLDLEKVKWRTFVEKEHRTVILENKYIKLTLLPEMGRVYSLIYKSTGHEEFWRNDIVRPGGGQNNDTGWWLWIGGAEYTLPGDEHGTTWAIPWKYEILDDSEAKKTVRMSVQEPVTRLKETIDISIYPDKSYYEADIEISNPTQDTVQYAHWINPQWTPGGHNELTDSTEFIIPTDRILIEERWQKNLGPSPQQWAGNPLRFISGWKNRGDLMADGLREGFYSAYSHDEEEGMVRVFNKEKTPGVDIWTYGYCPKRILMGSGAPNKGYAEMWGGTSKLYPDERHPLPPGESIGWTEWMYPYQKTKGLTYADKKMAVNFKVNVDKESAIIGLCSSSRLEVRCEVDIEGAKPILIGDLKLSPDKAFCSAVDLSGLPLDKATLVLTTPKAKKILHPQWSKE